VLDRCHHGLGGVALLTLALDHFVQKLVPSALGLSLLDLGLAGEGVAEPFGEPEALFTFAFGSEGEAYVLVTLASLAGGEVGAEALGHAGEVLARVALFAVGVGQTRGGHVTVFSEVLLV